MAEPEPPLDIRIHYTLYSQDGQRIPMQVRHSREMEKFVRWVRRHDRYGATLEDTAEVG